MQACLSDPTVQLIGLKATGGFGKSALVRKVSQAISSEQPQSATNLEGEQSSANRFEKVLALSFSQSYPFSLWGRWLMAHFGERIEDATSDAALVQRVVAALQQNRVLLIMDNVETLLEAEARAWKDSGYQTFLLSWLNESGESTIVLTSREQPDIPNNLMRYCRWRSLDGLEQEAGIALLSELGILGKSAALGAFVQEAQGHPLLLKLAAGWLLVEEPNDPQLAYLNQEIDGLNLFEFIGAHRGQPEGSVRKLLEATLARLPEQMQQLLPALSLYLRPFSVAAAQQMADDPIAESDLRRLEKRSLLQSKKLHSTDESVLEQTEESRIRLFEFQPLVQRYLRGIANPADNQKAIDYYQQVRKPVLEPTDERAATVAYEEIFYHYCELDDCASAFATLQAPTDPQQRYSSCNMVLQLRGYNAVRLTLYERLLKQLVPKDNEELRLLGDTLQALGDVLQFLKRSDDAIANYDQALDIYRQVGARLGEANTLKALGRLQADVQQGIAYLQSAQTLYEQINDIYSQGVNLYYLGIMYAQLQQKKPALLALQTAASLGEQINFAPLVNAARQAIQDLDLND